MKLENAKPGVEVIQKYDNKPATIVSIRSEEYVNTTNGFDHIRELRLANKPKRGELVKRVEELEGLIQIRDEEISSLSKHLKERQHQCIRLENDRVNIFNGTYFSTRPHREKWQHVAQVTGCHVTGDGDGHVKIHRGDYVPVIDGDFWRSANYLNLSFATRWPDDDK
jgi:hypothetical protein